MIKARGALLVALLMTCVSGAFAEPAKKVFVLGVDGLDPTLLQSYLDQDKLPNFKRLIADGEFKPLQTSMPPLSPVAWATFITGMDPGGHGVFDFIHRDAKTLMPTRAESGVKPSNNVSIGGCKVLPMGGGPENLRQGRAFWQILEEHDVPTTVFRIPANFPPVESSGKSLSGMGTPDIRGTPGTFSFYTDRVIPNSKNFSGGKVYTAQIENDRVFGESTGDRTCSLSGKKCGNDNECDSGQTCEASLKLYGPPHPFLDQDDRECRKKLRDECAKNREPECGKLETGFDVYLDPDRPAAKFDVGGREFVLQEGEWSEWIPVEFKALPVFASVSAIGRFYLKQVRPEFELYVTPLQIDPANPGAMQLSTPEDWSHELCEELGYFYTQELPEDTKALSHGVLDGREFWQQTQFVYHERQRAFDHVVSNWQEGLLFFYFSSIDQNSHMLWNYMDPEHPGHLEDELLALGIESLYIELDDIIGRALEAIDDETTFIVMSDHGFSPFYWQVNLNTWLAEKGYVTLDPAGPRNSILFGNVDWSRTQAYALGLNGLYVNLRGREERGIVNPGKEHEELLARLEKDLLAMVDPRNGKQPVSLVVNTRRDFHGPLAGDGPDLLVGYNWGYRSSWKSPLGEFPEDIFVDNDEAWSGDHSMDYRLVPGVLISNRPITLETPALYDLTVGVLDEFGVAKPEEMIGQDCLGDR